MNENVFIGVTLVVLAVLFFVCRELFCWYWKFNRMVELNELQRRELVEIKGLLTKLVAQVPNAKVIAAAPPE